MQNPKCKKCGMELTTIDKSADGFTAACVDCDIPIPPEEIREIYQKHCWIFGCNGIVESHKAVKSEVPIFGYRCPDCGADLGGWLIRKGVITKLEEQELRSHHTGLAFGRPYPHHVVERIKQFIN